MVWIVASVFYAYQYIIRVMPSIMLDDIMQQFHISSAVFGQFSGVYYIGYSLMHIPVGIMLDRFGPRKVMTGCIMLTVVGLLPLLFASHWAYPIIGRLFIGIGSSAAILGLFKIIRMSFSQEHFARFLSFSVTIGLLGAIYGGGPVSYMRDVFGYFTVVQMFCMAGGVLAAVCYWIVPDIQNAPSRPVMVDIKEVLGNSSVIWCCISAGLMVGPLEGFADVWAGAFLKQVYGYEATLAATLPSMIFLGMCFGAPFLSYIAEKTGSFLATVIGAGAVMAISFVLLLCIPMAQGAMSISFIIVGVASAYQILAIYKASTYVRQEVAGLTTAVANMIIMVFGYLFHTIIGFVVGTSGGPSSTYALTWGIAVIPCALVIGTVGFSVLLIKESSQKIKV
jgi:MFS family permease